MDLDWASPAYDAEPARTAYTIGAQLGKGGYGRVFEATVRRLCPRRAAACARSLRLLGLCVTPVSGLKHMPPQCSRVLRLVWRAPALLHCGCDVM